MVPWVGGSVPKEAYASTSVRRMNGQIQWALRNLPNFVVPGTRSLVLSLLGYVLLIGPVNFWVLRRIKRSELAWVTIPALVLVVTTLTYVVGFYSKGRDVFTNTISIVKVADTGAATASTYVGVFAPSKNSYRITFPGRANVTPVPMQFGGYYEEMQGSLPVGTRIIFGESTEVEFPSMNMWSMQAVNLEEQVDLGGKITASVYPTATGLRGTITNNSRSAFKDCYVVTRDAYAKIPSLAPGQTAEVAIEIKYDSQSMHGPFLIDRIFDRGQQRYGVTEDLREQTRKRQIMSTMIGNPYEATDSVNSPVTFLGFTDAPLTKVLPRLNPGSENPYLALVAVPLQISISKGDVSYPPGLIPTTLADQGSGMRGKFGPGFYYVDRGDLTFVMDIPAGIKQISAMSLHVMAQPRGGAGTSIEGYLYNWQTNKWDRFDAAPGENSVATPSVYVSPTGVVQYRVSATTNPFEMRDPTLSFTGRVE